MQAEESARFPVSLPAPVGWLRKNWLLLSIGLIVILKNWLLEDIPFVARFGFLHDDTLFLTQATSILGGNWLGNFSEYTLIKGPVYPLWLAFNFILGMDVIHAQDMLFLVASIIVIKAVSISIKNRLVLLVVFIFVYLNPVSYDFLSISHAFRMVIYTSLSLMVFGSMLGLFLRLIKGDKRYIYWSLLFGVAISFFWYTREEGVWVLPGVLLIAGSLLIYSMYRRDWLQLRSTMLGFIVIPVMLWSSMSGILAYMNWKHYGMFYIIEVTTPNFSRVYNALLSIEPETFKRHVPVRIETIDKLRKLSPKMSELKGFEGVGEKDYPAYMFIWAFRHSVALAGYYEKGAKYADQYYADLAEELEGLCSNGKIKCGKLPMDYVPAWRPEYTREFPAVYLRLLKKVIKFKDFSMDQDGYYSTGDMTFLTSMQRLTHARLQDYKNQVNFPGDTFYEPVSRFKSSTLEILGEFMLTERLAIFYLSILLLIVVAVLDIRMKNFNPYTIFSLAILGSIMALVTGLTIIYITAYQSLFRPMHGILPIVPLFSIAVVLAIYHNRRSNEQA